MEKPSLTELEIVRVRHGKSARLRDSIAIEEPLEIRIQDKPIAVLMRSPGHDEDLACGFAYSEGILSHPPDAIERIPCPGAGDNILNLRCNSTIPGLERFTRHVFTNSGCGICGRTTIQAIRQQWPAIVPHPLPADSVISCLPGKLRAAQSLFQETGGAHGAGLFDFDGNLFALREDVGRHNAVDKLLGMALRQNLLPLNRYILALSGRSSFELVQKAFAGGIPIILSVGAPSTLAVSLARETGQGLVGFIRDSGYNIYSEPN